MTLEEIKTKWNKCLERNKKAEKLAKEQPEVFEKYLDNFNELIVEMSSLMNCYEKTAGGKMPSNVIEEGFKEGYNV